MQDNATASTPIAEETAVPSAGAGRWLSILLIVAGLALIGVGGWMYLSQYLALANPPAPIVIVSMADFEETPTAQPAAAASTAVAVAENGDDSATEPSAGPLATAIPQANDTVAPTSEPDSPSAQSSDGDTLTLADNPLVVTADEQLTGSNERAPAESGSISEGNIADPDKQLTRIVAESIEMDADVTPIGWEKIIQNTEEINVWSVADRAAGWHKNSLLPGQGGNVVLSGHHNVKGEVFRYIVDLEPGAQITLYNAGGEIFTYTVEDKFIVKDKGEPESVRQANARWIGAFNDERLTLVTCWPYTNNTHRVIVIAKPVEDGQEATSQ